jgi:3-oxoadipate enol-lactonase
VAPIRKTTRQREKVVRQVRLRSCHGFKLIAIVGASAFADQALVNRAARASRPCGIDPSRKCRSYPPGQKQKTGRREADAHHALEPVLLVVGVMGRLEDPGFPVSPLKARDAQAGLRRAERDVAKDAKQAPSFMIQSWPTPAIELVARLAAGMVSAKPLADALACAPRLFAKDPDRSDPVPAVALQSDTGAVFEQLAARLGMRPFANAFDEPPTSFELAISSRVGVSLDDMPLLLTAAGDLEIERIADEAQGRSFESKLDFSSFVSPDGATVKTYAAGNQANPPIIVASACGMPTELTARWIEALADQYYVMSCETRGLLESPGDFDRIRHSVESQAGDLLGTMDCYGIKQAHIIGLCGGASLALVAAALSPQQVTSLSLWHGDYELGGRCAKTDHQYDFASLLQLASSERTQAAALHRLFSSPNMLTSLRIDVAHLLLYPYANPELLFRYGHLNGSIMQTDLTTFLADVDAPTLVVTSDDDKTAHPDGSRFTATHLRKAALRVEPHGDHLSLFDAPSHLIDLAKRFVETHSEKS